MMKVFVGGSRHVSQLNAEVRERLDNIVRKGLPVLVGDANGVDKAVQQYFHSQQYRNVEVFCSGRTCRNNVGQWKLRAVSTDKREKTFDFYAEKDRLMTHEADIGLMIWDGKSTGTLLNVMRLLRQQKKVVVYNVARRQFWELRNQSEWGAFVSGCDAELRRKVEEKAAIEDRSEPLTQQSPPN
jgi:hypothetical protein